MSERASAGEQLAGIAGLVLLAVMFLFAWFGVEDIAGLDAFDAFRDWVDILLLFAAFSGMALALFGGDVARVPIPLSTITAVLGGISSVVLLYFLIDPPSLPTFSAGELDVSIEMGRKLGIWLGLAAAIGVTIGGWQAMREEGATFDGAADRLAGREGPPAPPPAA